MATSEWTNRICAWIWIENHKWKMSFLCGGDILFVGSIFSRCDCGFVLSLFVGCTIRMPFNELNKVYESVNSFLFSRSKKEERKNRKQKIETACMTPSDNIVYVFCNTISSSVWHTVWAIRVILSCASKTNIVRRWLNYVCLCLAVADTHRASANAIGVRARARHFVHLLC